MNDGRHTCSFGDKFNVRAGANPADLYPYPHALLPVQNRIIKIALACPEGTITP